MSTSEPRPGQGACPEQDVLLRRHCWILVSGFDGVLRVISLLRQRRYRVRAVSAVSRGASSWRLIVVIDNSRHDDSTNLLVKRLNRLPDVLKVRYGRRPQQEMSIWD